MSRSREGVGGEGAAIQLLLEADLSLLQGPRRWRGSRTICSSATGGFGRREKSVTSREERMIRQKLTDGLLWGK